MGRIVLIVGGSRSGKSAYAQRLAESLPGRRAFIATASAIDEEMRERIRRHREARRSSDWHTIEEGTDLVGALREVPNCNVFLIDCLTLWVNNVMCRAQRDGQKLTEEIIAQQCKELIATSEAIRGTVIFVSNEVGMGIVPDNRVSRLFRDLAGRCNQIMADAADEVFFVACGLPLRLKQRTRP